MQKKIWFTIITCLFILTKLILHFSTSTNYELHRDEMLYFNMADHVSFGYASVPPMIGWIAWLIDVIFGYSVFGIRFFPALLGAGSLWILSRFVKELNGGLFALSLTLTAFLFSPGFLLVDGLFTPNVVEQFLWLAIIWSFFRLVKTENSLYWLIFGVLTGLSFLTKYSVAFLCAGLFAVLLISQKRFLIATKHFQLALFIGFLLILPNLIWQYAHAWPVVGHLSELQKTQLVNQQASDFFYDVFTLLSVLLLVGITGIVILFLREKPAFLKITAGGLVLTFILFFLSGGKGYYVIGLFPFLFAAGSCLIEEKTSGKLKSFRPVLLGFLVLFSSFSIPYVLPVLSFQKLLAYSEATGYHIPNPFSRWEDGKERKVSQVYSDMTGWEELAGIVSKTYGLLTEEEKRSCVIFAEKNYGYAGAIHFYGKKANLPDAITFNDSYTLWAPDSITGTSLIYIYYTPGEMVNLFKEINEIGTVEDHFFREKGLKVFLCKNPKTDIGKVYSKLAQREKSVYSFKSDTK